VIGVPAGRDWGRTGRVNHTRLDHHEADYTSRREAYDTH
jgi:hypothetical protein